MNDQTKATAGLIVFIITVMALAWVTLPNPNPPRDWKLEVTTKGANDIVHTENWNTLYSCIKRSKMYHSGGYEVNCRKLLEDK